MRSFASMSALSGDPIDLARATIAENLYRRQEDRDRLIKELVDLEQANISNAVLPKGRSFLHCLPSFIRRAIGVLRPGGVLSRGSVVTTRNPLGRAAFLPANSR